MNALDHRTRIKICGLTREQDVDAAVAAGADAIGLVMYDKSPRFVAAKRAGELARRLPPFVTPVLLFVNASAEWLGVRTVTEHVRRVRHRLLEAGSPTRWIKTVHGVGYRFDPDAGPRVR